LFNTASLQPKGRDEGGAKLVVQRAGGSSLQSMGEVLEIALEILPVVPPRRSVHAWGCLCLSQFSQFCH
jgi:hypothetical protein